MTTHALWCEWPIGEIGEKPRRYCKLPAEPGRMFCAGHVARCPVWPVGEVEGVTA